MNEDVPYHRSYEHYLSRSEGSLKNIRARSGVEPLPLRYRCSALPTQLTSQLLYRKCEACGMLLRLTSIQQKLMCLGKLKATHWALWPRGSGHYPLDLPNKG